MMRGERMKTIYTANILQCMHYQHEKIPGATPRIVMDYEFDINEGKATIANRFDSQLDALIVLKFFLIFLDN